MLEELLKILDEEIEAHRRRENEGASKWDRGFENGSMSEALHIKNVVYKMRTRNKTLCPAAEA